jgi:hypothetical protein
LVLDFCGTLTEHWSAIVEGGNAVIFIKLSLSIDLTGSHSVYLIEKGFPNFSMTLHTGFMGLRLGGAVGISSPLNQPAYF